MSSTPIKPVHLHPVTGAVIAAPMACCQKPVVSDPYHGLGQPLYLTLWTAAIGLGLYGAYRGFLLYQASRGAADVPPAASTSSSSPPSKAAAARSTSSAPRPATSASPPVTSASAPSSVTSLPSTTTRSYASVVAATQPPCHEFLAASPAELDSTLQEAQSCARPGQTVFVLVVGENVPSTGQSWCPDCVQAEPILAEAMRELTETQRALFRDQEGQGAPILVRAPVVRADWKNTSSLHPYRTHPLLKVSKVPTLFRLYQGQVIGALVEGEMHNAATVNEFVNRD